jgi:hypothetical protein
MEHPFLNKADLKELSTEQLQEKMTSLNDKLTFAYRTGNGPLIHQLQMAMDSYREEAGKKMDEILSKQNLKNQVSIQKEGEIGNQNRTGI